MGGKDRLVVVNNRILAIELCKEKSWIIVHEMQWGSIWYIAFLTHQPLRNILKKNKAYQTLPFGTAIRRGI